MSSLRGISAEPSHLKPGHRRRFWRAQRRKKSMAARKFRTMSEEATIMNNCISTHDEDVYHVLMIMSAVKCRFIAHLDGHVAGPLRTLI